LTWPFNTHRKNTTNLPAPIAMQKEGDSQLDFFLTIATDFGR
jgi:hypothetical protein